jgi:hypothetical protein
LTSFIDGNKRTAFGTADIFLRSNGHFLSLDAQEGQSFIVKIAAGEVVEGSARKWTRQRLKKNMMRKPKQSLPKLIFAGKNKRKSPRTFTFSARQ